MHATKILLSQRQPMIRFLGKRAMPTQLDHTPHAHPAAPSQKLPDSFASYRQKAQQHGPLHTEVSIKSIGTVAASSLGSIEPGRGTFFDRSELPKKFQRIPWTQAEIEAIESGGASMFA